MRLHRSAGCCGPRAYYGRFGGRRGFMGRFGGFMAPGWRMARMLASGDLQLIILALLTEKPRHGRRQAARSRVNGRRPKPSSLRFATKSGLHFTRSWTPLRKSASASSRS